MPFEEAPMGTTGLETAFAALHTDLVVPGVLPLALVVEKLSAGAALLGLPAARRSPSGGPPTCACSTSRPRGRWARPATSRARRTAASPGRRLRGRVLATVAAGAVVYRERAFALSAA